MDTVPGFSCLKLGCVRQGVLLVGRLFENIQQRGRVIYAIALRIPNPFHTTRTQSFDGTLRRRKRFANLFATPFVGMNG